MKEIKFRYVGRNLSVKWFTKIFSIQDIEENQVFAWMKKNNIVPSSIKRNQYIGLKDKNKKEIYEGDIIKGFFSNDYEQEVNGNDVFKKPVFHRKDQIFVKWMGNFGNYNLYYSPFGEYEFIDEIEIIGNIHENPELTRIE